MLKNHFPGILKKKKNQPGKNIKTINLSKYNKILKINKNKTKS